MYDRESRFRMEDTMNAARIEYTEKAVMHWRAPLRCHPHFADRGSAGADNEI